MLYNKFDDVFQEAKASRSQPTVVIGSDAAAKESEESEAQDIRSKLALLSASAAASSDFPRKPLSQEASLTSDATEDLATSAIIEENPSMAKERAKPKPRRMLPGLSRSSPSLPDEPGAKYLEADMAMKNGEELRVGGGDRRRDCDSDTRLDDPDPVSLDVEPDKSSERRPKSLLNLRDAEIEPISLRLSSSRTSDGRSRLPWTATLTPSPSISEVAWDSSAGWSPQSPPPRRKHRLLPPSPPGSLRSTPCSSHAHLATPMSPLAGSRSPRLARLSAFFRSDKARAAGVFSHSAQIGPWVKVEIAIFLFSFLFFLSSIYCLFLFGYIYCLLFIAKTN